MSFESFIDDIEELAVLPSFEKGEGGYFYPEEYRGKLYRHSDKLMYITSTASDEIQIPLVEAMYNAIESGVVEDVKSALESGSDDGKFSEIDVEITTIKDYCESSINSMIDDTCKIQDRVRKLEEDKPTDEDDGQISELHSEIAEITSKLNVLENAKPSFNLELIQKMVDKKFEDTPARVGKIKISTLSMLKESGFSIEEISELAKSDLI